MVSGQPSNSGASSALNPTNDRSEAQKRYENDRNKCAHHSIHPLLNCALRVIFGSFGEKKEEERNIQTEAVGRL